MSRRKIYREGQKFGKLTALEYISPKKYLCKCDCRNQTIVPTSNLTHGTTISCGCNKLITRINYDEDAKKKLISSISVDKNNCWIWKKSLHRQGYGHFPYKRKVCLAHRISWILHNGPISDEVLVLHKCDNPPCCNPDHLFLGDDKLNAEDRVLKHRCNHPKGEKQWCSKLTENQVIEIKKLLKEGYSTLDLSRVYGVKRCTIFSIKSGKTWAHIL